MGMNVIFQSEPVLVAIIALVVAFSIYASANIKFFKSMGSPLVAVLVGIILVNLKVVPDFAPVYDSIMPYAIYLSITLMLLNVDIKAMLKLSKKPILAMLFASIAVSFAALVGGLLMGGIEDGWILSGMFVGTYTGGSANLTAIGYALGASGETLAAANAADYAIGMPMVVLLFSMPAIYKRSKWLQKVWPYTLPKEKLEVGNPEDEFMGEKTWSVTDIAIGIAVALVIYNLGLFVGSFAPETFSEAVSVLAVTTFAIIAAQFKFIKNLKGTMDLGMFFALFYLVIIGFFVSIPNLLQSAIDVLILCAIIMGLSFTIHLLLCRLFKIEYEYVVVSITAAIWDGPTAALVASGAKWKSIIGIAVVLGVIGHAIGNYLGIGIAYLIRML
jgi:uncharacterized membrane protein